MSAPPPPSDNPKGLKPLPEHGDLRGMANHLWDRTTRMLRPDADEEDRSNGLFAIGMAVGTLETCAKLIEQLEANPMLAPHIPKALRRGV